MRVAQAIVITDEDRRTLHRLARGRTTPARLVLRAKIVLLAAAGKSSQDIAAELGTSPAMVQRVWKANRLQPQGPAQPRPRI